jgi:hypothetical protein
MYAKTLICRLNLAERPNTKRVILKKKTIVFNFSYTYFLLEAE